jgi:uncharacterized phage protein gp47/JayE
VSLTNATVKQINDQIIAQLEQSLNQTIPLLPKAFNRVLAKTLAAVFILLWKYAGSIFLNIFVNTASDKPTTVNGLTLTPLTEWGRLVGVGDPVAAVPAEFLVDCYVDTQSGSILSGTALLNDGNGVTYITIGEVQLDAPVVILTVRAAGDQTGGNGAGAIGNLDLGAVLSFVVTPANVQRDTYVASQEVTGADAESSAAYRQRIIDKFSKRPQGGAYADYEQWGEEVAGIINVYPYTGGTKPTSGPGQVDLYSEATVESSGSADGIPTSAQLDAVKASVQFDSAGLATRAPVNTFINSYAITRTGFDVIVSGLTGENLSQVEADITTGVEEYFTDREPYIPGLTVGPRKDRITNSGVAGICEDIASAAGAVFESVVVKEGVATITVRSLLEGEKAKADSVTFP